MPIVFKDSLFDAQWLRAASHASSGAADIGQIRCPTFVCSAEDDAIGVTAQRLFDGLTCPKTRIRFLASEGAGEHCETGARTLFNQRAFDWLDKILEH